MTNNNSPTNTKCEQYNLEESNSDPYENIDWSSLSDIQKAQLLLGSIRLLDSEIFLARFKSFEEPQTNY